METIGLIIVTLLNIKCVIDHFAGNDKENYNIGGWSAPGMQHIEGGKKVTDDLYEGYTGKDIQPVIVETPTLVDDMDIDEYGEPLVGTSLPILKE